MTAASGAERVERAKIVEVAGTVEFLEAGTSTWILAVTNQTLYLGDSLRTGARSSAKVVVAGTSVVPLQQLSTVQFLDRRESENVVLRVLRGMLYLFHRGDAGEFDVEGGGVNAAVRGTEFAFEVREDGAVVTTLYDGEIELTDTTGGRVPMSSGDVAVALPGRSAEKTARVMVGDWSAIQWALHYPAILDPRELGWEGAGVVGLESSWAAYRRGNLPRAMALYPAGRVPASVPERIFLGALLLSVGAVTEAETVLSEVPSDGVLGDLAAAHRRLIEVVRRGASRGADESEASLTTATALLGASYRCQAAGRLGEALERARAAVERSPDFGWAWVRVAELEFTLGRRREAEAALERGMAALPEHAEAMVLKGFLLAARNRVRDAEAAFEAALGLDRGLGNAWLGRGLCRIRRGGLEAGREDLMVAAATEPQRSILRSYLAKALADSALFRVEAREDKAREELRLAKQLDPGDPTPWLYSALLNQQGNRVNEAIDDLGESLARNDNRALFRSKAGLDQDRAVRSANLANVFADVGFQDIGVREATRAVNADYANASAHLFLANSYDALRDPRQINLRYETPWYSEYLLANLLSPVGAGSLSQTVSQNEYSKLFERDRLGLVSRTAWTSNGDWKQQVAQFGQAGDLAYALDGSYGSEVGQRFNGDLEQRSVAVTAQVQAGPDDTVFLQVSASDAESGDVLQRYEDAEVNRGLRLRERREPLAHVGWNHTWRPGIHTLFLVSPWNATQSYVNPSNSVPWVLRNPAGDIELAQYSAVPLLGYESRLTGVAAELQQLWQLDRHGVIAGLRYQHGGFDTTARLNVDDFAADAPARSSTDPELERISVYAYDQWEMFRGVRLSVGVSYDQLTQPRNFRTAPLTEGSETMERVLPKVGLTVTPWKGGTLRAAWARSLGGVSFDQSFRLEPVQVAGFSQVYRGLIPEALVGSVAGQEMEVLSVAWDQAFPTRTWLTVTAERLSSEASREIGGFVYEQNGYEATTTFRQELEFTERSVSLTVGQLVGRDLALTLRYRVAEAELEGSHPGLPRDPELVRDERSVLGQLVLGMRYQNPCGFFASWDSTWSHPSNHGDASWREADAFWQHDVWAGWRFLQRRAEVAVGLLNLTDEDYRLYPLNDHRETYRERTVAVTGRFAF